MTQTIFTNRQASEIADALLKDRYALIPVPEPILAPLREIHLAAENLFATSGRVKEKLAVDGKSGSVFGYQRFGSVAEAAGLDRSYETFDWTMAQRASSEFVLTLPTQDLASIPALRNALSAYHAKMRALQGEILAAVLPLEDLRPFQDDPLSVLRLIRYSELSAHSPIPAHTDYEWFSVTNSNREGLEVLSSDGWREVQAGPDAFVLLAGNCLEIWTEGRFKSCRHRVTQSGGSTPRQSIVYFANLEAGASRPIANELYRRVVGGPVFSPIKWVQQFYIRNVPELYALAKQGRFSELAPIPERNPITGEI